jgi:hypothetical protein
VARNKNEVRPPDLTMGMDRFGGVVGSCLARRLGKSGAGEIADGGFFLRRWSTRAEWCPEWSESLLDGRSENLEEMDLNQNRKGR